MTNARDQAHLLIDRYEEAMRRLGLE